MSVRAMRIKAAVATPAVAAAATLAGLVAAPQAMAAPTPGEAAHSQSAPVSTQLTRAGKPSPGVRVVEGSRTTTAPAVQPESSVYNFGLSSAQAKNVQRWLNAYWGYNGSIDGLLGPASWKAFQRNLKTYWGYTGAIDGIPGTNTVKALQRLLRNYGYKGAIDGIAGSGTEAAFKRFANAG